MDRATGSSSTMATRMWRVEREINKAVPTGTFVLYHVTSQAEAEVQQSIAPEVIALWTFGCIAALAALLVTLRHVAGSSQSQSESKRSPCAGRRRLDEHGRQPDRHRGLCHCWRRTGGHRCGRHLASLARRACEVRLPGSRHLLRLVGTRSRGSAPGCRSHRRCSILLAVRASPGPGFASRSGHLPAAPCARDASRRGSRPASTCRCRVALCPDAWIRPVVCASAIRHVGHAVSDHHRRLHSDVWHQLANIGSPSEPVRMANWTYALQPVSDPVGATPTQFEALLHHDSDVSTWTPVAILHL